MLNRAVWIFGSFVDRETDRYRYWVPASSEPSGKGRKSKKDDRRTDAEVVEYRRALIEQTPYKRQNIRNARKMRLADFAKRGSSVAGGRRKIVQTPGKPYRVEE